MNLGRLRERLDGARPGTTAGNPVRPWKRNKVTLNIWGRGGGLVDIVADSGPYDPSSNSLGDKKENK